MLWNLLNLFHHPLVQKIFPLTLESLPTSWQPLFFLVQVSVYSHLAWHLIYLLFSYSTKNKLFLFIINFIVEASLYPSKIITHILEAINISFEDIPFILVKKCCNSKAFIIMGYIRADNTWVPKSENTIVNAPPSPRVRPLSLDDSCPSSMSLIILNHISDLEVKMDSLKDLLLTSYF